MSSLSETGVSTTQIIRERKRTRGAATIRSLGRSGLSQTLSVAAPSLFRWTSAMEADQRRLCGQRAALTSKLCVGNG